MSTDLDPPAVPPLTPGQRDRLRRQILQRSRPRARRTPGWAAPLVAVGAVTAIVAGTLAVIQHPRAEQPPTTQSLSPSPSQQNTAIRHPAPSTSVPPLVILPFPTTVDLGPVPAEVAEKAAKSCHVPGGGPGPLHVLWARKLKGVAPDSSFIQLVVQGAERSTGPYSQVLAVCQQGIGVYMIPDAYWAKQPTARQGVSMVIRSSWSTQPTKMYFQNWTLYRARPEIARIESRYVWPGGSSEWITGAVAGGFAYTDSRAIPVGKNATPPAEEIRAYDAQGRRVPLHP
ncbi:hypothetical protein ACI2LF_13315 [Kribbella sp. NPDC020789]